LETSAINISRKSLAANRGMARAIRANFADPETPLEQFFTNTLNTAPFGPMDRELKPYEGK
jgi:hypothetical protein